MLLFSELSFLLTYNSGCFFVQVFVELTLRSLRTTTVLAMGIDAQTCRDLLGEDSKSYRKDFKDINKICMSTFILLLHVLGIVT